jgi:hypothetical protein
VKGIHKNGELLRMLLNRAVEVGSACTAVVISTIEDNSKAKEVGSSAIFDPMSSIVFSRASLIPLDNTLGAWFIGLIVSSV